MKKISLIVLIASSILLCGCESNPFQSNNKKQIEEAKNAAIVDIGKAAQAAIVEAEHKISSSATNKLGEASKEIESAIQTAQATISENVKKEATEQITAKLADTKKQIDNSMEVARLALILTLIALGLGVVALVILLNLRKKCSEHNIRRVIYGSLYDEQISSYLRHLIETQSPNTQSRQSLNKKDVERIIDEFLCSKKFQDILNQRVSSSVQRTEILHNEKIDNNETTVAKVVYQIFARESTSMILSSIQETYQRGKSFYKLTMSEPGASTAEITVCIEREEVKQRILKFDSQYFEPICSLIRSSNEPTEVVIKTTGTAERIGEEWKVIRPIIVEIK